jgi:hypothetical protein
MRAISLVPDFGRIAVGKLSTFDHVAFRQSARSALLSAGVQRFILGLDVSLDHEDRRLNEAFFQLQWWGLFQEPDGPWRDRLKALVNSTGIVTRPLKVITPDSLEAAAAYGLKSTFTRRVSYTDTNLTRLDRGKCRNTRDRLLRGEASIELMLFLDRIGLENRLLGHGVAVRSQPLRSRVTPAPQVAP